MNKQLLKVCFIAPAPPPFGGISKWLSLMCSFADDHRKTLEYTIINISPSKSISEGRNMWDRIIGSGIDMLRKKRELVRLIKKEKIDVIHMTTSGQLAIIRDLVLLKAAGKRKIPSVYHIHMGRTSQILEGKGWERRLLVRAMRLASTVVVLDQNSYAAAKRELPHINIVKLPNPIDLHKLPKLASDAKKEIVFVGWNIPTKGVEELVSAWNNIGKQFPDYCLRLIGPVQEQYKAYLDSLVKVDNIVIAGELPHEKVMEIMNSSSVFILPSHTEGFPNVIIEAMALKKPIIATKVGAIPEMLDENRGILIESKSIEQIEEALINCIMNVDGTRKMAQNAYDYALKNYDISKVFIEHEKIWNCLAENQGTAEYWKLMLSVLKGEEKFKV